MAVVYIKETGAYVRQLGEMLVISKNGETLQKIPISYIEHLVVIGNVQITSQALKKILECGCDISYLTYGGKYIGQTSANNSKNIFLRLAQYEWYNCEEKRMELARCIVDSKIKKQIAMIQSFQWKESKYDWKSDVAQMNKMLELLKLKTDSNEIMGVEGFCSTIYFGAFSQMLKGIVEFKTRNRRPPRDPVNALLSLGYTFLTKDMCNLIEGESFEPYLGFLHGVRYGRKSLALDMIEEFRQPVIDRFIMYLFKNEIMTEKDFRSEIDGVFLENESFGKFCKEYEKWMCGEQEFRNKMKLQCQRLKRTIQFGEVYETYHGNVEE